MAPPITKIFMHNIRINEFNNITSDDKTTANATLHYLSTDNTEKTLKILYYWFHTYLQDHINNQLDIVITLRPNSSKHRDYLEDATLKQELDRKYLQTYREKKREQRILNDPDFKPKRNTYKYKPGYGPHGKKQK